MKIFIWWAIGSVVVYLLLMGFNKESKENGTDHLLFVGNIFFMMFSWIAVFIILWMQVITIYELIKEKLNK